MFHILSLTGLIPYVHTASVKYKVQAEGEKQIIQDLVSFFLNPPILTSTVV